MKAPIHDQQLNLTDKQKKEIRGRDKAFAEGKTTVRPWEEIKKELEKVYR